MRWVGIVSRFFEKSTNGAASTIFNPQCQEIKHKKSPMSRTMLDGCYGPSTFIPIQAMQSTHFTTAWFRSCFCKSHPAASHLLNPKFQLLTHLHFALHSPPILLREVCIYHCPHIHKDSSLAQGGDCSVYLLSIFVLPKRPFLELWLFSFGFRHHYLAIAAPQPPRTETPWALLRPASVTQSVVTWCNMM